MVRQISHIPTAVYYVDGVEFGRAGGLPCCHEVEGFEQGPKRIEDRREDAWEGFGCRLKLEGLGWPAVTGVMEYG